MYWRVVFVVVFPVLVMFSGFGADCFLWMFPPNGDGFVDVEGYLLLFFPYWLWISGFGRIDLFCGIPILVMILWISANLLLWIPRRW